MRPDKQADPDNPSWSAEDFRSARPSRDVLPGSIADQLVARDAPKVISSIGMVVRAEGPGLTSAGIAPLRFRAAA
jgi:hypothetical protein